MMANIELKLRFLIRLPLFLACSNAVTVQAVDIVKANNSDNLNLGSSWVGNTAPGSSEIAVWDNTSASGSFLLGADLEFQGMRIGNPGGVVTISAGNTLTLGSSGIDIVSRSLNIVPAMLLSAAQEWTIGTGLFLDNNNNANTGGVGVDNQGHDLTINVVGVAQNVSNYANLRNLAGSGDLIKDGLGRVRFVGANANFTGNIILNDGVLRAANDATSLGTGSSTLTLNGGQLTFGSNFPRDFGRNTTVAGNAGLHNNNSASNGGQSYTFGILSIGAHTLTVTAQGDAGGNEGNIIFGATTLTGSPVLDVGTRANNQLQLGAVGELGGSRGITKRGVGTLILTAAGTYTGTTRVEAGTLSMTHGSAVANSGTIRVDAGATLNVSGVAGGWTVGASQTLTGRGTVLGNTTVAGTLSPGASPGNITFENNLTLSGTYDWEYGDLTIVQNLLTLQDSWVLNVLEGYGLQDRNDVDGISVALFGYDAVSYEAPASVTGFGGYLVTDVRDDGEGTIWLDNVGWAAIIPEPGTVMLIGLGSLVIWLRRRVISIT
jgi:autotransporter-associated beta strand protein